MKEYNKNIIKIAIDDHIDEIDYDYLNEIGKAASDPRFANNEERDAQFLKALDKSFDNSKTKTGRKTLLRVASVFLALLIGLSVMTLTVKGFREKLWELLSNLGNPSYSSMVASRNSNDSKLAKYEGKYIPKYIPEGYKVVKVDNKIYYSSIVFKNGNRSTITFTEYTRFDEKKLNLNKEDIDHYETLSINNREITVATEGNCTFLLSKESDAVIYVTFDDKNIDIIGFATHIEKK